MSKSPKSSALRTVAEPVLLLAVLLVMASPVNACPMCKDSCPVDNNPVNPVAKTATADQGGLSFNKSIYFMLGGLAGVVGFTGSVMYKATKQISA